MILDRLLRRMDSHCKIQLVSTALVLSLLYANAQQPRVSRAYLDPAGAIHVVFTSGSSQEVKRSVRNPGRSKSKSQREGESVGWLVDYPNPDPNRSWEGLAGTLVLWGNGRVMNRFQSEQVFYDWSFVDGGRQVAFHTGPLHGEEVTLRVTRLGDRQTARPVEWRSG